MGKPLHDVDVKLDEDGFAVDDFEGVFDRCSPFGAIFLDEIGELPLDVQAKLLRVLQEMEFERVGGTKTLELRARIIAATNKHLESEVKKGRFR